MIHWSHENLKWKVPPSLQPLKRKFPLKGAISKGKSSLKALNFSGAKFNSSVFNGVFPATLKQFLSLAESA